GYVEPSDIQDAAKTAGLTAAKSVSVGKDWSAQREGREGDDGDPGARTRLEQQQHGERREDHGAGTVGELCGGRTRHGNRVLGSLREMGVPFDSLGLHARAEHPVSVT
ncbi:DUF3052 family protein, partial [Streptomyces tricolor]